MIIRSGEYLEPNGMPPPEMLNSVISEHLQQLPRLERLRRYYLAESDITKRARADGLPNNRVAHPLPRYITAVATGYLVGKPVEYSMPDPNPTLDAISDMYLRHSVASADIENARNASICGRGVEYIHIRSDTDAEPHISVLRPEQAFVVYDDGYEMQPLFGVYYAHRTNAAGQSAGYRVHVMSKTHIAKYTANALPARSYEQLEMTEHYFGDVPMVEYWNDENERGDFESVLSLVDAYDKLQSDRVNDKEQFVNALLLLIGCTMDKDERGRSPSQQLREDKALSLPDSQSDARYLTAELDEAGAEVLRAALVEDIHKLSMVPNLSDKDFAANASGVAMRYKLFGLEQLINIKQPWFAEGLRSRLKLMAHYMAVRGMPAIDVSNVQIGFSRALPVNELELAQIVQAGVAAGAQSLETAVRTLHRGDGWSDKQVEAEVERIRDENAAPDLLAAFREAQEQPAEE